MKISWQLLMKKKTIENQKKALKRDWKREKIDIDEVIRRNEFVNKCLKSQI